MAASGNHKKLLLVEDEALIAINQKMELERYGYSVEHVFTGEEAVETALRKPVDLILMDIDLGKGIDGTQAAEEILKIKDVPLVFLSSHTEPETAEKTEKITSYGYIVKNSGFVVIDASIKMAFRLFEAHKQELKHEASLRLLSKAIESTADAVLITDRDGNIEWTNPAWTKLTGYPAAEAVARNPRILKSGVQGDDFYASLWRTILDGETWSGELINRRRDGSLYHEKAKITPLIDEDGEVTHFIGIKEDISERKQAEMLSELTIRIQKALLQSSTKQEILKVILRDIHDTLGFEAAAFRLKEGADFPYYVTNGFSEDFVEAERHLCAWDENGEVVCDAGGSPLLECMCGNVIRGSFDPALPFFNENGSFWTNSTTELLASTCEEDRQARTRNRCNGEGYESVALITLPGTGGNIGLLQLNDSRKGAFSPGLIDRLETLARTIAAYLERSMAEELLLDSREKMSSVFRVAPTGIGVVIDRIFSDVNPRVCRMTGYSRDELVGRDARMLYPTREEYEYVGREKYHQITQKGTGQVETVWRRKDGSQINVLLASTPIDISDISKGVTFTALDITEQKQAEETIKRQLREKETFLKEVHHRIKNNIASVASLLRLQADSVTSGEARDAISRAVGRVESMRRIYDKLLIEERYEELHVKEYLEDLAESILDTFSDKRKVTLAMEIEDLTLSVSQLFPLGTIVNELVTNSLKHAFAERDSGEIGISLKNNGTNAVLSVYDNGRGMQEGSDPEKFSGFGLMLVKALAEQIDGSFRIRTGPEARCDISFPL